MFIMYNLCFCDFNIILFIIIMLFMEEIYVYQIYKIENGSWQLVRRDNLVKVMEREKLILWDFVCEFFCFGMNLSIFLNVFCGNGKR